MKAPLFISFPILWLCAWAPNGLADSTLRLVLRAHEFNEFEAVSSGVLVGRLEAFSEGAWGTVCIFGFDIHDADVACLQLGYLYASSFGIVGEYGLSEGTGSILYSEVGCSRYSTRIQDCDRGEVNSSCTHSKDVAVSCTNSPDSVRLVSQSGITAMGQPLVLTAGRLEIRINMTWGTVCDDLFGATEADVACRQLGFPDGSVATSNAGLLGYPSPTGPIWLDDLNCAEFSEDGTNIRECDHGGAGLHNCAHAEDVILSCLVEGSLRLISAGFNVNQLSTAGRLEVYVSGRWGIVCDDGFGDIEANVVCKQLGFPYAKNHRNFLGYPAAPSDADVILEEVNCDSTTFFLLDCNNVLADGSGDCDHEDTVGVECITANNASASTEVPLTNEPGLGVGYTRIISAILPSGFISLSCIPLFICCFGGVSHYMHARRARARGLRAPAQNVATSPHSGPSSYPIQQPSPYPRQPSPYPTHAQQTSPYPTHAQQTSPYPTQPHHAPPPHDGLHRPPSYADATTYPPATYPRHIHSSSSPQIPSNKSPADNHPPPPGNQSPGTVQPSSPYATAPPPYPAQPLGHPSSEPVLRQPVSGPGQSSPQEQPSPELGQPLSGESSGQPLPEQPLPGQPLPGQPLPEYSLPGQPYPGEPLPGQTLPGQPLPEYSLPGHPLPGEPLPEQPLQGQPLPGPPLPEYSLPGQPLPGEPLPGQPLPGPPIPGQPLPEYSLPGQPFPGEPLPGQPLPGPPLPGQPLPGQSLPEYSLPGQPLPEPLSGQPLPGEGQSLPGQVLPEQLPGQPLQEQPLTGQPLPGQPLPGEALPEQLPGQRQSLPEQPLPAQRQSLPEQPLPAQRQSLPEQPLPEQPLPAQRQSLPEQPLLGQRQSLPEQPLPEQQLPGQQLPGQPLPEQTLPPEATEPPP